MKTNKICNLILTIGVISSFIISLIFLFKSYSSLQFDDANFVFNTSILTSNVTTLVILVHVIRRSYLKNKIDQGLLFSKYLLFSLLVYVTLPLEIIVYNLYEYGAVNFTYEKLTSFLFGIACVAVTVYMIQGKDTSNRVA